MTRQKLSTHFSIEEFDCHDGTRVPVAAIPALERWCTRIGEPLRERFGPVRVTSGYRTAAYNQSVGGAAQSFHVYDRRHPAGQAWTNPWDLAADVVPARGNPLDWQKWARARFAGPVVVFGPGRGAAVAYPGSGFVHIDSGPTRTWAG